MRVQHNIASMNAYRNYNNNTKTINRNIEKLSSGYKINRAGDDAAGLAISEKMRAQITGLEGAQKNAKDGISLVQTAEGALTEVHSMLNRMYSLAEQSANGTYDNSTDRAQLQKEVGALRTEINRIADSANFNGLKLLDGSMARVGVDWAATEGNDNLQSHLGISLLAEDKQDLQDFVGELNGGDFEVKLNAAYAEGATVDFTTIGTLIGNYNVVATDSNGNELANWAAGATAGEGETLGQLSFGASGGDFAYDGDHQVTFKISTSEGKDVASITYRMDISEDDFPDDFPEAGLKATLTLTEATSHKGLNLQIGDDANSWNIMNVSVNDIHAEALGIANIDISEQGKAQTAMNALKTAINYVSDVRGGLGATQNRLDHTINNLSVMQENIQDAESTIRDTDVADEMMRYTKNSILVQSAQAMLAQANQQPQGVLQLLQ